jgi:hypothetical protein
MEGATGDMAHKIKGALAPFNQKLKTSLISIIIIIIVSSPYFIEATPATVL